MKIVIEKFVWKNWEYYFRVKDADSGKVLLKSEWYTTKSARDNGIESVMENAQNPVRYEIKEKTFNLKARNWQVVATSVVFPSKNEMESIISQIQENIKDAEVIDVD
jgi:uncharacterized protein YegP (UPF0339 family)